MLNTDPQFLQPFRGEFVIGRITRAVNNSVLIHTIKTEAFVRDKRKKKLLTPGQLNVIGRKKYVSELREYRTLSSLFCDAHFGILFSFVESSFPLFLNHNAEHRSSWYYIWKFRWENKPFWGKLPDDKIVSFLSSLSEHKLFPTLITRRSIFLQGLIDLVSVTVGGILIFITTLKFYLSMSNGWVKTAKIVRRRSRQRWLRTIPWSANGWSCKKAREYQE